MTVTGNNLDHHIKGISYMLVGTVLFASNDALGKWLTADYPIIQIAWFRSVMGLLLVGLFVVGTGNLTRLKTAKPAWHLVRGILGTILTLLIYYTIKYIPIAEFTAIVFSTPLFLAMLSPVFLNEHVSRQSWFVIGVGFIGILIMLRPTPDHFHIAHLTALATAMIFSVLVITARLLSKSESQESLNFYIYPINIALAAYWAIDVWVMPNTFDWMLFIALGLTATLGLACFLQAMHFAPPSIVAPIDYIRLIWVALLGYFIWGEIPDMISWVGMAIIVFSGIYLVRHGTGVPEDVIYIDESEIND